MSPLKSRRAEQVIKPKLFNNNYKFTIIGLYYESFKIQILIRLIKNLNNIRLIY